MHEKIERWEPENFIPQTTSVWSFPQRGNWATHDAGYRGNWSPYIPRNLLLRYSNEGDWILDQFAGGGTTLVEAKLLRRNIIGIDVNNSALLRCKEKCSFTYKTGGQVILRKSDARRLDFLATDSIDLVCTHPPYANIIRYSQDIPADLSRLESQDFLHAMKYVADESWRVLKKGRFCAILMGDIREKGIVIPLGFNVMQQFLATGFKLKEIILKEQHNCGSSDRWEKFAKKYNFLLLMHEYLFIFVK